MERIFSYSNPAQLRDLLAILTDECVELTVYARAQAPEEFHKKIQTFRELNDRGWYHEKKNPAEQELAHQLFTEISATGVELHIMPFTTFKIGQYEKPDIDKDFNLYDRSKETEELLHKLTSFARITEGWRFRHLHLDQSRTKAIIQNFKEIILGRPDYEITSIHAGLHPHDRTSDHYYDTTSYAANLSAGNGRIKISGTDITTPGSHNDIITYIIGNGNKELENTLATQLGVEQK